MENLLSGKDTILLAFCSYTKHTQGEFLFVVLKKMEHPVKKLGGEDLGGGQKSVKNGIF